MLCCHVIVSIEILLLIFHWWAKRFHKYQTKFFFQNVNTRRHTVCLRCCHIMPLLLLKLQYLRNRSSCLEWSNIFRWSRCTYVRTEIYRIFNWNNQISDPNWRARCQLLFSLTRSKLSQSSQIWSIFVFIGCLHLTNTY